MANWTTPITANVGDTYTAAWYNQQTRDNSIWLHDHHAVGDYKTSAQTTDHGPWLLCTQGGRTVSRTMYADLFAVVGTSFGAGDGSTTFGLPDQAGRVVVFLGAHADVNALGKNEGNAANDRSPKHNHTHSLTLPNHVHSGVYDHSIAQAATGTAKDTSAAGINTGNPTTNPAINGTVGPGGTRPNDTPAFIVLGNLFIHI